MEEIMDIPEENVKLYKISSNDKLVVEDTSLLVEHIHKILLNSRDLDDLLGANVMSDGEVAVTEEHIENVREHSESILNMLANCSDIESDHIPVE